MGSLNKRLSRLEEHAGGGAGEAQADEEREKERWLATARCRRRRALGRGGAWQAKGVVKVIRERYDGMSTEEFRERLLAFRPPHDPNLIELFLARTIYLQESGTENMVLADEWRESFEAGEKLRCLYEAIPDEVIAKSYAELDEIPEDDEEAYERWRERYEAAYSITAALLEAAAGPDREEITDAEVQRRLEEHVADVIYGEKGLRVSRLMEQMREQTDRKEG